MPSDPAIIADWIAVDWGSTRLRAWAISRDGAPLAKAEAALGMGKLSATEYEPALLGLVANWLAADRVTPALLCGMVGAKQGWREAAYGAVPADLARPTAALTVPTDDARLSVRILPGLAQAAPPDVMRGEETLLAGLVAEQPGFDGIAVLPGTHSKWAWVRDGRLQRFATYFTGELFALLAETSMLRHSVTTEGWSDEAFAAGLREGAAEPEAFSNRLFALRAAHLLENTPPEALRARLSGLVIGLEFAGALKSAAADTPIAVIADPAGAARYLSAFALFDRPARRVDSEAMALAGLGAAYGALADDGEWT